MTLKTPIIAAMAVAAVAATACKTQKPEALAAQPAAMTAAPTPSALLPDAQIYRMNGDWSQYVPVGVNADRSALTSFPAPSDITPEQAPVKLADGWWLDRRGIGPNTAFTSYTYTQYAALPATPRPSQLLHSLMPGAEVTEIVTLPMKLQQATADIPAVNKLIADGLQNCKTTYTK